MKTSHHNKNFKSFSPCCFLFTVFFFLTTSAFAFDFDGSLKKVTITDSGGTNVPPNAVITYTQDGDTVNFDGSGSTDSDGNISEYRWDFGDGTTGTGNVVSHSYTGSGSYPVTLAVRDNNGAVALIQLSISTALKMMVNFQPATSPHPPGYDTIDSGGTFDSHAGYGWVNPIYDGITRDRDSSLSPDQAYYTLVAPSATSLWEAVLPNGSYKVTVCVGDPSFPRHFNSVQVEGVVVINDTLDGSNLWIENSVTVDIADGRLSITFNGTEVAGRLCWIIIESI